MAHSTPAQTATASGNSSSSSSSYSSGGGGQAKSVASTILKRHVNQRQRFDSADYALIQSANTQRQQRRHRTLDEQEPEPEVMKSENTAPPSPSRLAIDMLSLNRSATTGSRNVYPQQHVRRIRLQRFDSADWVMDAVATSKTVRLSPHSSPQSSSSVTATASTQAAVAKLILDRHAYTTCHFVTTPVDKHQRCAEKA